MERSCLRVLQRIGDAYEREMKYHSRDRLGLYLVSQMLPRPFQVSQESITRSTTVPRIVVSVYQRRNSSDQGLHRAIGLSARRQANQERKSIFETKLFRGPLDARAVQHTHLNFLLTCNDDSAEFESCAEFRMLDETRSRWP